MKTQCVIRGPDKFQNVTEACLKCERKILQTPEVSPAGLDHSEMKL